MKTSKRAFLSFASLFALAATSARAADSTAAGTIWIEAEDYASASQKVGPASGWGNTGVLSKGAWLHVDIEPTKEPDSTNDTLSLSYKFDAKAAGAREIWARVGFERVRSPFDWRVDGGEWRRVSPDVLTTDLQELAYWAEVAWLKLGDVELGAGEHSLDIRVSRKNEGKGNIFFSCDAVVIADGVFHPNSKWKPGEDWRSEDDKAAAANVFKFPEGAGDAAAGAAGDAAGDARVSITLDGLWEVARNDEQSPPFNVAAPMMDFPAKPFWTAIKVPSDKNYSRPDLVFAHRLWYRTRVEVPASMEGRAFILKFPYNNLNTTVFVNGEYCGFEKNPFVAFQIDVTKGIKAGQVNEIWVGIRDAWYGRAVNPKDPLKLRRTFNLPLAYFSQGFQDLSYPIWNHAQSGILQTPSLEVAGAQVYAEDVFAKPSVSRKALGAEITVRNSSKAAASGTVKWSAVNTKTGKTEKAFKELSFAAPAGEAVVLKVEESWADPKLWWPDEPNLYYLRTEVSAAGAGAGAKDTLDTRFGFREWDWSTKDFKLNGIVWHGWADTSNGSPEAFLKKYKERNQTVMRFWGTTWNGMRPGKAMDFFDENGIVCRRSGIFDGEAIGYHAIEQDPDMRALHNGTIIKMDLLDNWRDQIVAQVKAERNHPSVMIWSIENEYLYINCINLHGGEMDLFETEITKAANAVAEADPTRPTMVDGGGAAKAQTLPVHGDHYVATKPSDYPPLAYVANTNGGGRGRWSWDMKRPRFIGEDYFMSGNHPEVAAFQGDSAFAGKPVAGVAIWNRILQEGYRWAEQSAWHYWLEDVDTDSSQYIAYAARAVFVKEWNWTFESGKPAVRNFGVFNDTRFADPIRFDWTLSIAGKKEASGGGKYNVAPGARAEFSETIKTPRIKGDRAEGELLLTLTVGGKEVFRDVKKVSVIAPKKPAAAPANLAVFDPEGETAAFLQAQGYKFARLNSLDELAAAKPQALVIGRDALDARESSSSRLAALAAGGMRIIVLEQENPLRYQGLPAEMDFSKNSGYTAFGEDFGHPALANLDSKDFFDWGDSVVTGKRVYKNAYEKPRRGARSLAQCDDHLKHTALAEIPVGSGLVMACQFAAAENIAHPAAQQLILNLVGYAATYKLEHHPVAAAIDGAPQLKAALDAIGLRYTAVADPLDALKQKAPATAIVDATPANLAKLAANPDLVKTFTEAGGALVLAGLGPEGLADYNKIVGFEHSIRKFGMERLLLPAQRSRLAAGLTAADIALYSSKRIFHWTSGNYVADDVFDYVVDYDEVAPFGTSAWGNYKQIINGFVSADGWPLIINFAHEDKPTYQIPIDFPKKEKLSEFTWIGNALYSPQNKVNLILDGDEANKLEYDVAPNAEPQTFAIDPPREFTNITLEIAKWTPVPGKEKTIGIDNIYLRAARPPEFLAKTKLFTNIGGMMDYERGAGHIILCNLLFQEQDKEQAPANVAKKRAILAAVLRNLKAPFAEGKTVVAGMNLAYAPIDISKHATQYRDDRGKWFGNEKLSFKDMPGKQQRFNGVLFDIFEFATSPVPNALMLAGRGAPDNMPKEIKGLEIGKKADALFILQAANIPRRRDAREIREGKKYELAKYTVNYADGEKEEIPIYAEIDVENYAQKTPAAIPGAQIAWVKAYEGSEENAVAYMKQWNNPRPEVEITTIDLASGDEGTGAAAVLAITAATAE